MCRDVATERRIGRERGASMLEATIAILLLSIGCIGMAKSSLLGLLLSKGSQYEVAAAVKAAELMDLIQFSGLPDSAWTYPQAGNRATSGAGGTATSTSNGSGTADTPAIAPASSGNPALANWFRTLGSPNLPPNATASVRCASRLCTIEIRWNASGTEFAGRYTIRRGDSNAA